MHRFSFLGVVLPAIALAACSDSSNPGAAVAPLAPETISSTAARGAQIARALCASCHGADFRGGTAGEVSCPDLNVVRGYTLEEFDALLSIGTARDGDMVDPLMSAVSSLTSADILALREYLIKYREQ